MILLNHNKSDRKALFTGDLLCPLLRNIDIKNIENCDVVFTDTNNRFAYPASNHWSFLKCPEGNANNPFFENWYNEKGKFLSYLIGPNLPLKFDSQIHGYFDNFIKEQIDNPLVYFSISDFVQGINPKMVNLVHYSGGEDTRHHSQAVFDDKSLEKWASQMGENLKIKAQFKVPKVGQEIKWI